MPKNLEIESSFIFQERCERPGMIYVKQYLSDVDWILYELFNPVVSVNNFVQYVTANNVFIKFKAPFLNLSNVMATAKKKSEQYLVECVCNRCHKGDEQYKQNFFLVAPILTRSCDFYFIF